MPPRVKSLTSRAVLQEHEVRTDRFRVLGRRLESIDVEEVWGHLERELTLGDGRANLDVVHRALDSAETNLRRAGMLAQIAAEQLDVFEMHWRAAFSEWAWTARQALEQAKKDKRITGQVTQEQVENWVAAHVPEYRTWRERRREMERHKALTKQMHEAWQSRGASLRKQVDLVLAKRGLDPNLLPRRGKKGQEE